MNTHQHLKGLYVALLKYQYIIIKLKALFRSVVTEILKTLPDMLNLRKRCMIVTTTSLICANQTTKLITCDSFYHVKERIMVSSGRPCKLVMSEISNMNTN